MSNKIETSAEIAENSVLALSAAALIDENDVAAENMPLPQGVDAEAAEQKSPAEWAYARVILYLQKFEEQLDSEHEIALGMAGSESGTLQILGVGFFAPDIITFYGRDENGQKTQLIQHISQLNVLLKAVPKLQEQPNRIGFKLASQLNGGDRDS